MRNLGRFWVVLGGLLAACASSGPLLVEDSFPAEEVSSWEEGCADERSLVLACREDEEETCGFFRCRDVAHREVLLAYRGGGGPVLPGASPAPRRWWGPTHIWPRDREPIFTFRVNRHFDRQPLPFSLPPGRWARHHLLPQAEEFREWFHSQGIPDIHQYTILIPESVHIQIHSAGPRGGLWNQAWRDFKTAQPDASSAEIYRHAGALLYRFQLTGLIVPYHGGRPPR
ncbi:SitA6 family polymorphic toxin lipoprotein [Cystobacter fuscus]|uniref:SitA6 family polymorphic toxin lipoprotein n=1 Tax=Cystobacter fuscus TaxID=43 RepID=UPI0005BC96C5|nr:TIGR02269 family lipoprotein [Cystobacter fuscus]